MKTWKGKRQLAKLEDYEPVIGKERVAAIRELAVPLQGVVIQHINSTAVGGGVAEILKRLVPLMEDVGLVPRWDVLRGTDEFFSITKLFHNAFHGQPVEINECMFDTYREVSRQNFDLVDTTAGFVVLHDQQPLGLAGLRPGHPGDWLWYCHIDPVDVDLRLWDFLRGYAARCDGAVYHLPEYVKELGNRVYVMPPSIDPLSEKNRDVDEEERRTVLARLGVPGDLPLVVQVSRFDRLKDPVGVIRSFRMVRDQVPCRLVLAGGGAGDDPQGLQVLEEVRREAAGDPDIMVLELAPDADLEINVLQRSAAVIVQKSVREGFGLTVTEAMWKSRPVVATPVGGIRIQVLHEETGLAAAGDQSVAEAVVRILKNPGLAAAMGRAGHELVRRNFIIPVYLERWLGMLAAERSLICT
ncbi:glycosyl transferase family 1 [Desulfotomaculum copahuensis]|uniref:Glycosyl transferase family 1 n=2 Tax=Desulfotomaculum copahuensis TaxID=1838280 RepID=A0A1B7LID1_9FIRM|nr:glycosyl transferase family 1 [Desulfotomaculum copahuensis]